MSNVLGRILEKAPCSSWSVNSSATGDHSGQSMTEGLGVKALKEKGLLQLWMMPKHKPWKYHEYMKDSVQVGKPLKSMYTCVLI